MYKNYHVLIKVAPWRIRRLYITIWNQAGWEQKARNREEREVLSSGIMWILYFFVRLKEWVAESLFSELGPILTAYD